MAVGMKKSTSKLQHKEPRKTFFLNIINDYAVEYLYFAFFKCARIFI